MIESLVLCRIYSKHGHKQSYYFVLNANISGIIIYTQSKLNPLNCCQGNRAEDDEGRRRDRVCVCVCVSGRAVGEGWGARGCIIFPYHIRIFGVIMANAAQTSNTSVLVSFWCR